MPKGMSHHLWRMRLPAFSLLEMALVLIIFGVVLAAVLPLLNGATTQYKRAETLKRQERILTLLGTFTTTYKWALPLPAAPTTDPSQCGVGSPTTAQKPLSTLPPDVPMQRETTLYVGHIPYHALEIPEEWTLDAWGHPMTYAIVASASSGWLPDIRPSKGKHDINHHKNYYAFYAPSQQTDAFDNLRVANNADTEREPASAFIVLVSHGPQGAGALKAGVDQNREILSHSKQENANRDEHFVAGVPDQDFDDLVSFVTVQTFTSLYAPGLKINSSLSIADATQNQSAGAAPTVSGGEASGAAGKPAQSLPVRVFNTGSSLLLNESVVADARGSSIQLPRPSMQAKRTDVIPSPA